VKWVTREFIHLDRVACPWLIKRFIDPEAEFNFVPWGQEDERPEDAIPFSLPGAELSSHDENGTTFEKLIRKYQLDDRALDMLATIVASGVHHALHRGQDDVNDVPALEGIGLDAISEGMMLLTEDDYDNVERSLAIYDALYLCCRARLLAESQELPRGMAQRVPALREALRGALAR
jgi:hypothetical protein